MYKFSVRLQNSVSQPTKLELTRMLPMLPLLFGLSCGTAALHVELDGAPEPVADLVHALQVEITLMATTLQKENSELRSENQEIKNELSEIKNKISLLEQGQLLNAIEVRSSEDDIQQNKIDIIDLRINDGQQEVVIRETLNMIDNMNTTIDELEDRLALAEERTAVCGYIQNLDISSTSRLNFDRVYDEVDSTAAGGHLDAATGKFTAGRAGIYYISVETAIFLDDGEWVFGDLKTTSGMLLVLLSVPKFTVHLYCII